MSKGKKTTKKKTTVTKKKTTVAKKKPAAKQVTTKKTSKKRRKKTSRGIVNDLKMPAIAMAGLVLVAQLRPAPLAKLFEKTPFKQLGLAATAAALCYLLPEIVTVSSKTRQRLHEIAVPLATVAMFGHMGVFAANHKLFQGSTTSGIGAIDSPEDYTRLEDLSSWWTEDF